MALAIVETVRCALHTGQPLRQSDILALCAVTDQLWHAQVSRPHTGSQHIRDYMRNYMRLYRAEKRTHALEQASAT